MKKIRETKKNFIRGTLPQTGVYSQTRAALGHYTVDQKVLKNVFRAPRRRYDLQVLDRQNVRSCAGPERILG